ncbi:Glycerol-3-phosphate acyltransferase [Serratia symbiotica]|nr:Glycerol-3-phosphate acyltransferase [Serratia symbiotica]
MLNWNKIYLNFLDLLIKFFIKSKIIPFDPIKELNLDLSRPILYILPVHSNINLLTLRSQCLKKKLPDPLHPLKINNKILPSYLFIYNNLNFSHCHVLKKDSINFFYNYLNLHKNNINLNIQILLVSVMFSRSPKYTHKNTIFFYLFKKIKKLFFILYLGRNTFIYFSKIISMRYITTHYSNDQMIVQKLARIARIYFLRQHLAANGPNILKNKNILNKILNSKIIKNIIQEEINNKKNNTNKIKKNTKKIIKEIAANFSYSTIRIFDYILSWILKKLFNSINVTNINHIRQLAQNGYKIVYIPCHRSHMDYLLLSYILYHQGLVPPHIAAGINLNFWPIGSVFRRLGAFFIRRTFNKNKLYSIVFREYLTELFNQGYSIEYFIEGGRSRTGYLLEPKTGTLSMTIQAILHKKIKKIILIPVYISYEHIIEINTYYKELNGITKKKENLLKMLYSFSKLCNLGKSYINFGNPLLLNEYLNKNIPHLNQSIKNIEFQRPTWLIPITKNLSKELMMRINNATVINSINLCAIILLSSNKYSLTYKKLLIQLECYLQLIRNVPYSYEIIIPTQTSKELLIYALNMNKFYIKKNKTENIISIPPDQIMLMTYFRNNIFHILVLPSLIAKIIYQYKKILKNELLYQIQLIYPILKSELFLKYKKENLNEIITLIIKEMIQQKLIYNNKKYLELNPMYIFSLKLLSNNIHNTLQQYTITMSIININPNINKNILEKENRILAKKISIIHNINISHLFNKTVFMNLITILREEKYIKKFDYPIYNLILKIYIILKNLMTPEIKLTLEKLKYPIKINKNILINLTNKK